jgi:hypothetical protein
MLKEGKRLALTIIGDRRTRARSTIKGYKWYSGKFLQEIHGRYFTA